MTVSNGIVTFVLLLIKHHVMTTIEKLRKVESQLNSKYYSCRNTETFFEQKSTYPLVERWEKLISELRGWADYRYDDAGKDLTLPSWLDYAQKAGLNPFYTIGDVIA